MRISHKLALGFFVVIGLMVLLTIVGIGRVSQIEQALVQINQVNSLKQRHAIDYRGSVHDRAIALRDLVLIDDPGQLAALEADIDRLSLAYEKAADGLQALLSRQADDRDRELHARIMDIQAQVVPLIERIRQQVAEGDVGAARQLLVGQIRPGMVQWLASINAFIDWQEDKSRRDADTAMGVADSFSWLMVIATTLALVVGVGIAWFLGRQVVGSLGQAVRAAEQVSAGHLDFHIDTAGIADDEAGQLLRAMAVMRERLSGVVAAQVAMAQAHADGQVSYRIDETAFSGQYAAMVRGTNALVASHLATIEQLSVLIGCYAEGDLVQDMPELPGELAHITLRMAGVKSNLAAINREIGSLAAAAARGDFSLRGDEHAFDHDFRQMVVSLNALMHTADANLGQFSTFLRRITAGELGQRMEGDFHGVFAQMRDDANATASQLGQMMCQIVIAAEAIHREAADIAGISGQMAGQAQQQASGLQQAAQALSALTGQVRGNASQADQASRLAIAAVDQAEDGRRAMERLVTTMDMIQSASDRMAGIIGVIDGLAFQTNLLALNAAVEAARAGELGRGFAVVAGEVRRLAQDSAESAHQVKALISAAIEHANTGAGEVQVAGRAMGQIVTGIGSVTETITRISQASQLHSGELVQLSNRVESAGQATAVTAERMMQMGSEAAAMQGQGNVLVQAVSQFKL